MVKPTSCSSTLEKCVPLEEFSFEMREGRFDGLTHDLKRIKDGFSFKKPAFTESYVDGRLDISLHFRAHRSGEEFHVVIGGGESQVGCAHGWSDLDGGPKGLNRLMHIPSSLPCFRNRDHMLPFGGAQPKQIAISHPDRADLKGAETELDRFEQSAVLIPIIKLVDDRERLSCPAVVRLARLKKLDNRLGKVLFKLRQNAFEFVFVDDAREFQTADFGLLGVKLGVRKPSSEHLVEGRSQVVDCVSGDRIKLAGQVGNCHGPNLFGLVIVELREDSIRVVLEESLQGILEVTDVGIGALNLAERGI